MLTRDLLMVVKVFVVDIALSYFLTLDEVSVCLLYDRTRTLELTCCSQVVHLRTLSLLR